MDSMHLIYLGVIKRLMKFWLDETREIGRGRLSAVQTANFNRRTACVKSDIPIEFARKMRSSNFFKIINSTEFRFLLNYVGPICAEIFLMSITIIF